ncbi:MAG TPA: dihydrofolate reductase family protein [Gemmatimonadaceae bacterium]
MGKVRAHMSMSLDGIVAGPEVRPEHPMGVGGERLHQWLFAQPADPRDAEVAGDMFSPSSTGAVIMGRRTFEVGVGLWGDDGTFHLPCFVVTHRPAKMVLKGPTSFTFVTDGIQGALERAQAVAGSRAVNVMGAAMTQQFLSAGLLDEFQINLIPVLLGTGTRLFEQLGVAPLELERTRLIDSAAVTHLTYRVVK